MCTDVREYTGNDEFVELLTVAPAKDESEERKDERARAVAMMYAVGLLPIYGVTASKKWCTDNKGKIFPQSVSISCAAYFCLLLLDKRARLEEEFLLKEKLVKKEDQLLHRKFQRSRNSVSEDVRNR